ncbi:GNAT family N-acetyltransferase [Streptomyces sp. YPW6]|uniref:GNAT family N-acetyltransferase n=1 Tax=Streptomyces sp. YPW6 TaxID=2840373 RepID=UPI001C0C5AD4|nr:GNAT family N-acetyltransferase [Streptomyces sp. YPW6]QWQ41927.1 GNAT family N-acetyltransferase [Streptomyces sp. YPW6]
MPTTAAPLPVTPPPFATARLDALPLEPAYAEEMAAVLADPVLYDFTGGEPPSRDALRVRYERQCAGSPEPGERWWNWVLRVRTAGEGDAEGAGGVAGEGTGRADGEPDDRSDADSAGQPAARIVGYVQATVRGPRAEIAWVIGTPWQGRGYAREAARGLAAHLASAGGVRELVAHIHPDHAASAGVAVAAGLGPTGEWEDGERRWAGNVPPPPMPQQ